MEVKLSSEQPSKATFEVFVRPLSGLPGMFIFHVYSEEILLMPLFSYKGTESKALAESLQCALLPSMILTNNPRSLIQLVAQSLSPTSYAGSYESSRPPSLRLNPPLIASLINASSLALLNASSFPMCGIICAIGLGRLRESHTLIVDPSEHELHALDGGGVFAFLASRSTSNTALSLQLVWSSWNASPFDQDELVRATAFARGGAEMVWEHMKDSIRSANIHTQMPAAKYPKVKAEKVDTIPQVPLDDVKMEIV